MADTILKIATIAPEGSSWMNALKKADRIIRKRTNERVKMQFYAGGVLGDEQITLKKIRLGQIDGALFTSDGLSSIYSQLRVTEVPFLFTGYKAVDYLMKNMKSYFEEGFEKEGFTMLGWSEVGFVYLMGTKPLARIEDIRGSKVWLLSDSDIARSLFRELGFSTVSLKITDVLVGLQTGLVDIVYNSPLGAIALQWFTKIKYLTKLEMAYAAGGLVVKSKKFNSISPEDRATVKEVAGMCMDELKEKTRSDNEEALKIMANEGVQIIKPEPGEVKRFREIADRAVNSVNSKLLSKETLDRARELLKRFPRESEVE
jgi:TRAP-type C4-dicarboxylate transport system substrate-binding protein